MSKYIAIAACLAFFAFATETRAASHIVATTIKCKDGTEVYLESACDSHGGATKPITSSTPIDASKRPAPTKTAASKDSKSHPTTQTAKATTKTASKTAAHSTRTPTAKCLDGAYYFSTERRGACAKHGGVDSWYGW